MLKQIATPCATEYHSPLWNRLTKTIIDRCIPFPTRDWGLFADIRSDNPVAKRAALDIVVRRYWKPVFLFLRYSGADVEAANLLQTAKRAYPLEALRVSVSKSPYGLMSKSVSK